MSVNFKKSYLKNLDFVFCKKNIICNCYAIFKNPLLEQIRLWMRIRSGPYLEAGGQKRMSLHLKSKMHTCDTVSES